jgi:2'-5' RNA ligase
MKRLFIGVPIISNQVVREIQIWKNSEWLSRNILKWVTPENWHITLVFLGATPESEIPLLQQQIENIFINIPAFSSRLIGLGIFPNSNNPKVLWSGIEDLKELIPASNDLKDLLQKLGFSLDNKPLKPHLTLARIKNTAHLSFINSLIGQYQNFDFGTVDIKCVILYESLSTPEGPVYKPLFVKNLN